MSKISFVQVEPGTGKFMYEPTSGLVCTVWMDVDGYWKTDASTFGQGLMESHHHRMIADKLDEMNAEYEAQLKAYFDALPKEIDTIPQHDDTPF